MKSIRSLKKVFFQFALSCIASNVLAQYQDVEIRIDSLMKQYKMVGLSVAVVKKGKIVYVHSFGSKNIEKQIPLRNDDIFRIASISKSFSATSIMQLVEEGKVSLDDDVSKLIGFTLRNPRFPGKVITLKMLMSHTSSLNDNEGYFTLDVINPDKNPNADKCYNDYEPGSDYQYCNLNYNMVGTIVERVSGQRFDKYVKTHILDPLGLYGGYEVSSLDSTKFVTLYEYDSTGQFIAQPNAYNPRREEIDNYIAGYSTPIFSPTGGMKISAVDLARYMTMHMYYGKYKNKRIMSKKSAKTMQKKIYGKDGGYGLAIETTDKLIPGKTMKGHTGSAYGLYSIMFFQPHEKFGIVAITNGCVVENNTTPPLKSLANVLYESMIK